MRNETSRKISFTSSKVLTYIYREIFLRLFLEKIGTKMEHSRLPLRGRSRLLCEPTLFITMVDEAVVEPDGSIVFTFIDGSVVDTHN